MLMVGDAKRIIRAFADTTTYEDVEALASELLDLTGPDEAQPETGFWYYMQKYLMTAVMAYVRFEMDDSRFSTVMMLFHSDRETLDANFEDVTERNSKMIRDYEAFQRNPEITKQSIMVSVVARLQIFSLRELYENVAEM